MAPVAMKTIRTTGPMFILIKKGTSSRNLLIRAAAYDTAKQRKILPVQEMKAADMEMRKRIMVSMPNRYGEEEGRRMKPYSSDGIYVTKSAESQCILIAKKRKMKEEEKIKNTKVNTLKRAARMNQRAKSFAKLFANLPNDMMSSDDPSTPLLLQVLIYL